METIDLYNYDQELKKVHGDYLCGSDECGIGAFSGPIVAAAVVFPPDTYIEGVMDSKRVSAGKRARLSEEIKQKALVWHVSYIWPDLIDRYGVKWANRKVIMESCQLCEKDLLKIHGKTVNLFVIDQAANIDLSPKKVFPKADLTSYCVAAASIIGKVARDDLMTKLSACYPRYYFHKNKGYINKEHIEAIKSLGFIPDIHRSSFRLKCLEQDGG